MLFKPKLHQLGREIFERLSIFLCNLDRKTKYPFLEREPLPTRSLAAYPDAERHRLPLLDRLRREGRAIGVLAELSVEWERVAREFERCLSILRDFHAFEKRVSFKQYLERKHLVGLAHWRSQKVGKPRLVTLPNPPLILGEILLLVDESEPVAELLTDGPVVNASRKELARAGTAFVRVPEVRVLEQQHVVARHACHRREHVDGYGVDLYRAPLGQRESMGANPLEGDERR